MLEGMQLHARFGSRGLHPAAERLMTPIFFSISVTCHIWDQTGD